ncbi:hypothetical protein HZA44_04560 [Candidatus Peregrinibacteria bacterium]|nr:hypothetical protein [Candidatus Peregrinibacteria bacterium]
MEKRLFKNRLRIAIVALLVIGGVVALALRKASEPSFPGFTLEKAMQEDALTHYYEFEKGETALKLKVIRNIDEPEAKKVIDGKILTIEALYGNEMSPYPGMLSNEIVCSQDMTPKRQETGNGELRITYFVASLTNRLSYGNCVESETPSKAFIAWVFCPAKREYRQMEWISPKKDFDEKGIEFIKATICN